MKSSLSAMHLFRHLVLFLFVCVFLLTMVRAAYVLWQFPKALESGALIDIFLMGLRYDLALAAILLLPALVLGSVFGMLRYTRPIAKFFVVFFLMVGMLFMLLTELMTAYFLTEQGVRPDLATLMAIEDPVQLFAGLWSKHLIPAVIGVLLVVLIALAYWARLEVSRLMRFPLAPLSTIFLLLVGLVLCGLAVYSGIDPAKPPLSPTTGLISSETVLNEIALNTGYKSLYALVTPYLPSF